MPRRSRGSIPDLYLGLEQQEYNPIPPTGHSPAGRVAVSMNVYEPVGVVSAISAYNFPFYLNVWKTLPPLMAGCSVVLRPSPLTPLSAMLFGEAADAAGLPSGVLNVVIDQAIEGGKLITTHPAVDMVTFTGSTQVGREIMAQAASTVKKVHLELGGKSAAIYLPEAAENAWHMCLGVFMAHQGQGCALTTRILVPHDRKSEIIERAAEFARQLPIGDPSDHSIVMGPLITDAEVKKSEHYVAAAVEHGATLVTGGRRPAHLDRGHFYEPTLLDLPDNFEPGRPGRDLRPRRIGDRLRRRRRRRSHRQRLDLRLGRHGVRRHGGRDEGRGTDPLGHDLGECRGAERLRPVRRLQAERDRPGDGRARLSRVPRDQAPVHRLDIRSRTSGS